MSQQPYQQQYAPQPQPVQQQYAPPAQQQYQQAPPQGQPPQQYAQQPGYQQAPPQVVAPPWAQAALAEINQGRFPSVNEVCFVGQVAPSQSLEAGFKITGGNNGRSSLQINLKLRREYVKNGQTKSNGCMVRIVLWGQRIHQIAQMIRVGTMLAVRGEFGINRFEPGNGQAAIYQAQITLNDRTSDAITVLGWIPFVDERQPSRQGQQPHVPQPNYQQQPGYGQPPQQQYAPPQQVQQQQYQQPPAQQYQQPVQQQYVQPQQVPAPAPVNYAQAPQPPAQQYQQPPAQPVYQAPPQQQVPPMPQPPGAPGPQPVPQAAPVYYPPQPQQQVNYAQAPQQQQGGYGAHPQ